MKRTALLKYLHPGNGVVEAVLRHAEVKNMLARKICTRFGVPDPKRRLAAVRTNRRSNNLSSVPAVDGVLLDRERGFFNRFTQGRVRVHGAAEVFAAPAEFHHRDDLGD